MSFEPVAKVICPVCNHKADFVLSKEGTIKSLDDLNIREKVNELLKDHATIKETFIIDQLQTYMVGNKKGGMDWVEPVRLRLQEKEDWKREVENAIDKVSNYARMREDISGCIRFATDIKKELNLK